MVELRVGSPLTTGFLLALVLTVVVFYSHRAFSRRRLPGPRGIPFLGNTFQVPSKHFATYLKDLHSRYGGLVYLNINRQVRSVLFKGGDDVSNILYFFDLSFAPPERDA